MGTGRPCSICRSGEKTQVAAKMIASGATDQAIADRLGEGLHRMAVSRHRRLHIEAPARAVAEMAGKGQDARQQRDEQLAAIERGDPLAIFKLDAIANDISRIAQRLDGSASEAAAAGQHGGHAALAGQLLRQAELRARLGGHDRPAPIDGHGAMFSVTIQFSSGQAERISVPVATIDGDAADPPTQSDLDQLVRALGAGSRD
jgi:hypothetical protein